MATKTGWATNVGRTSGVQTFDVKRGESPGMRFLRCRAWLNEMLNLLGSIDLIAYEQAHHRGGHATSVCAEQGIESMPVHTATLKKWATSKGNANKQLMIEAARARGWDPADDNEVDSALLLEYVLRKLGDVKTRRGECFIEKR